MKQSIMDSSSSQQQPQPEAVDDHVQSAPESRDENDFRQFLQLYKAFVKGDWETAQKAFHKKQLSDPGSSSQLLLCSSSQPQLDAIEHIEPEPDISQYLPLYKASINGDWETAKRIFEMDQGAITAKITAAWSTALHIAVGTGKAIHFVEKLVELMPKDALALRKQDGETALGIAAVVGKVKEATILINKNPDLIYTTNNKGLLPVHMAAQRSRRRMLLYLLSVIECDANRNPIAVGQLGVELLVGVIQSGFLDVALKLVQKYPHLAPLKSSYGHTPLTAIAGMDSTFRGGIQDNFWQRFIYYWVPMKLENYPNDPNDPNGGDIENPTGSSQVLMKIGGRVRFFRGNYYSSVCQKPEVILWDVIGLLMPHIQRIREKKSIHHQALQLVKCLCKEIKLNDHDSYMDHFKEPFLQAAKLGIHEVVEAIVDTYPAIVWSTNTDGQNIFHIAVKNRCENVFNLIYQLSEHQQLLAKNLDNSNNTILHLAGILAPPNKLNLVSGAALQMQRELQWFEETKKLLNPVDLELSKYHEKEDPALLFTKQHKELVKEGEKWMKDAANSCTFAAALIATVVFAAAFTVPGGNQGDSGLPILSTKNAFKIFAMSDAIALFTSTTSLLMFLSILTSRYAEQDFLYALPNRLIIGLVTLFLSITSMMIAFSAAFSLVLGQKNAWIIIPVAVLACLPVTSFVTLQFPLLVDLISSTYGQGIFGTSNGGTHVRQRRKLELPLVA